MKTRDLFILQLSIMKNILNLGEFKLGKTSEDYKFFKREVMNCFYNSLKKYLEELRKEGNVQYCECKTKMRSGYSECKFCGGCGYRSIDKKDKT